jgi:hypothetical protein
VEQTRSRFQRILSSTLSDILFSYSSQKANPMLRDIIWTAVIAAFMLAAGPLIILLAPLEYQTLGISLSVSGIGFSILGLIGE